MAKKKAQHLYELLGQKSEEAKAARKPASVPVVTRLPGKKQEAKEPSRRHVPVQYAPVVTPAPVGPGQEHVLDNVITMRRDTAIVGALFLLVLLAVAFVLGRTTAPVRHSLLSSLSGS